MQSPPIHAALGLLALALLAPASQAAEDAASALLPYPIVSHQDVRPAATSDLVPVYLRSVSLAISDKSFGAAYRENSVLQDGFWTAELLVNDANDVGLSARMMRVGQVVGTPVRLGVGLGVYGIFFDTSGEKLYALAICGSAQYDLPTQPPTTATLELAIAPDITTFNDGQDLFDINLRIEVEVNESAVAFVGARVLDANTQSDGEFTSELHVGVRLGL